MSGIIKKAISKIAVVVMVVSVSFSVSGFSSLAASGDTTVYITKTGECYHSDGCSSLSKSKIETTLENASGKYRPCSKCNPPIIDKASTESDSINKGASAKDAIKDNIVDNTDTTEKQVYLSATGKCYHSKNNCGNMNPDKATKVSLSEAEAKGKTKCSKCWK